MRWLALWTCACSCSSNPSIGSIGSHAVEVARIVGAAHAPTSLDPIPSIDLVLTDDTNFPCENIGHVLPEAARSLDLRFFSIDGGSFVPPTATGAYHVVDPTGARLADGQYGYAIYVESDPLCHVFDGNEIGGHEGTLTLTQLSATAVAGSFDLTLSSSDRLAGKFAAQLCTQATDGGACR